MQTVYPALLTYIFCCFFPKKKNYYLFLENKIFTYKKKQIKLLAKHFHWKDSNLSCNLWLWMQMTVKGY